MSISSNQRWQFRNNYWHGSLPQSLCDVLLEPSEIAVEGMCKMYISSRNFSFGRLTRAGSPSFLVSPAPTKGIATTSLNFWASHVAESLVWTPVPVLLSTAPSPHAQRGTEVSWKVTRLWGRTTRLPRCVKGVTDRPKWPAVVPGRHSVQLLCQRAVNDQKLKAKALCVLQGP